MGPPPAEPTTTYALAVNKALVSTRPCRRGCAALAGRLSRAETPVCAALLACDRCASFVRIITNSYSGLQPWSASPASLRTSSPPLRPRQAAELGLDGVVWGWKWPPTAPAWRCEAPALRVTAAAAADRRRRLPCADARAERPAHCCCRRRLRCCGARSIWRHRTAPQSAAQAVSGPAPLAVPSQSHCHRCSSSAALPALEPSPTPGPPFWLQHPRSS